MKTQRVQSVRFIFYIVLFFFVVGLPGWASTERIEEIRLEGNKKVSKDTVLFYMSSSEKGLFSRSVLRGDFKALWKTGFFENISIEAQDGAKGKIVILKLKENPTIKSITYKTGKKVKEKDIIEKLQDHNISLTSYSYYNPHKIHKITTIIQEMLREKGYTDGEAELDVQQEKEQVSLIIRVKSGRRTRIGTIAFPGLNERRVSSSFLRRGMKTNKPHNLLSTIGGKDVYNQAKIKEDLEHIKARLRQKGYLEAKVGSPVITKYRKSSVVGRIENMLRISIPIEMGPRYRVGAVKIEGNKIVKSEFLNSLIRLPKGTVYNIKKRDELMDQIRKLYNSMGYIYCNVVPEEDLDPVKQTAALTVRIHEGEVAYVGKLEFKGNTFTKDHVLRREWFIREGGRLNMSAIENCITRMRQLGLVNIDKMPEFKPDPQNPQKVDIDVDVKEINRQAISFNVGYSGYSKFFAALGYSTKNFMGMGETLAVNLQVGTQANEYRFSFTEPFVFGLPFNLGASIHSSSQELPDYYTKKSKGFSFSTSGRIKGFWGGSLAYSYADVDTSLYDEDLQATDPYLYYMYNYSGKVSSISPTLYYSTVNSPLFPSAGRKLLFNYRYSGGFMGGDVNLHSTRIQLAQFIPLWKKKQHSIALQFVYQGVTAFGGKAIPYWEKLVLGGEQSVRGFPVYTISPRNENGDVLRGNKAFYFNCQYQVPLNQQISMNLFYDVGNVYGEGQPINLRNIYTSIGLEVDVFVPMLNVPFRLIFAYNPRVLEPGESSFSFRFGVGAMFQ